MIKPLRPSLREKLRYVVFEIISKEKINFASATSAIKKTFFELYGSYGLSGAAIKFFPKFWNAEKQRGIVKSTHLWAPHLRASFTLIREIGGQKALVYSLGTSGTILKAREKYFEI